MAISRTRSRLIGVAPPPSPIATGKGLRSAAVDDRILAEYLEKTLQVPDLVLPESQFSSTKLAPSIPSEIDFESLAARDGDSISRVLESFAEFGMLRIVGHQISANELESAFAETDCLFQIEKRSGFDGVFDPKRRNREQFFWFRSREANFKMIEREMGPDRCRKLSEEMERIFSEFEGVAETIVQILSGDPDEVTRDRLGESVLRLCRYNCDAIGTDQDTSTHSAFGDGDGHGKEELGGFDHDLSLYIFDCDQDFHMRTDDKGLMSFKARRGTIIVAIKKFCEVMKSTCFPLQTGVLLLSNVKAYILNSKSDALRYVHMHLKMYLAGSICE
ncbi:hypothetical protein Sjap_014309 [Stephania japonica]|uniref:Non-haem dioxygenase N-terminal domain-containing protein n=1 Tax=Stephania japonica TaxID=461633 RepID=A0AAP0IZF1_9MAGN